MKRILLFLFCVILCFSTLTACNNPSADLLSEARNYYTEKDYLHAISTSNSIIADYPDTYAAKQAQTIKEKSSEEYAKLLYTEVENAAKEENWNIASSSYQKMKQFAPESTYTKKAFTIAQSATEILLNESQAAYENENWDTVYQNKAFIYRFDTDENAIQIIDNLVISAQEKEASQAESTYQESMDNYKENREEKNEQKQNALSKFRTEYDKVSGTTWYYPASAPQYINNNACYIYMGAEGADRPRYWLRWIMSYAGNDWIFFDNIIISIDGTNYYKTFDYFEVNRDNNYGGVWEYVDIPVASEDIEILNAIVNSDQTIIRFQGDTHRYDKTVTQSEKDGIQAILEAYNMVN